MATEAWKVCQVMSAVVPDPPVTMPTDLPVNRANCRLTST
jgi:hypothetical protein